MVLDYIKSIREECVAALAESREAPALSPAGGNTDDSVYFVNHFTGMVKNAFMLTFARQN